MKIKRIEGRKGEPQEFVEFQTPRANYIAQEAGGQWFVFYYGKPDGAVKTLDGPLTKDNAILRAEQFAKGLTSVANRVY